MKKEGHLLSGKSKSIFTTADPQTVIMHFRDDLSAFDGNKKASCPNKGIYNNLINVHLMEYLTKHGIKTHHIRQLSVRETLVHRLDMLKVEFVVRNIAAGSICKRLGLAKGHQLPTPVYECFLKNDELRDPLINASHIQLLNLATPEQVRVGRELSASINQHLSTLFAEHGIDLVDLKLEFGIAADQSDNQLYLGDEITPDSCRLWEQNSKRPFDKDIFRFDLGDLGDAYRTLMQRLGIPFSPDHPDPAKDDQTVAPDQISPP